MSWVAYLISAGGPFTVLVIGLLTVIRRRLVLEERQAFGRDFRTKFIEWCNSRGKDRQAYTWLMLNSNRMQSEMGGHGIYEAFKPPGASYMFRNYAVILNMLPQLRQQMDESEQFLGLFASTIDAYAKAVDEALLRYLGSLDQSLEKANRIIRNPFAWFQAGIEQLVSVPLLFLSLFGIIGIRTVEAVQSSILFRIIAAAAALVGVISSGITVLLGWEQAAAVLSTLVAGG